MFCPQCGNQNAEGSIICANCGAQLVQGPPPAGMGYPPPGQPFQAGPPPGMPSQPYGGAAQVPSYLVHAILVTIFCCLPLGIVSIIYAAQVNGKLQAGDYRGAVESSNNAKKWAWIGFGIGIALQIIVVIINVIGAIGSQY